MGKPGKLHEIHLEYAIRAHFCNFVVINQDDVEIYNEETLNTQLTVMANTKLTAGKHPMTDDPFWRIDPLLILHPPHEYATYKLTMSAFFNASHYVSFTAGQGNLHRHSFHLKVTAMASKLAADNSLVPYETLREIMLRISAAYEGTVLNDLPPFRQMQPTTEILAGVIAQQVERLACDLPVKIIEVSVMESPTQGVTVQFTQSGE